ncbi:MAG: hypothetical protein E7Z90_00560 [Cyanobacteria bacterium SIG29]|nr:hypothetical protein [Cyanobacteria bacterium SIG29]
MNNNEITNINIPAFDVGTTVPTQTTDTFSLDSLPISLISICLISAIVFVILLNKFYVQKNNINRKKNEETFDIQEENKKIKEPAQTKKRTIEIPQKQVAKKLSTPKNLSDCITLFLENTRTK